MKWMQGIKVDLFHLRFLQIKKNDYVPFINF
jgi:hypothetical protein